MSRVAKPAGLAARRNRGHAAAGSEAAGSTGELTTETFMTKLADAMSEVGENVPECLTPDGSTFSQGTDGPREAFART